jgi:thiamine biosynthesis protein ThiS
LLERLDLTPELVVVERNREILERARLDRVTVAEGDAFEVVHFVGGG